MANVGYPSAVLEMGEVQTAVQSLGLEFFPLEIRRAADIVPAFDGRAEAVYVVGDALINANLTRILILAAGAHLPTIFNSRDYVRAGGLISYGPSFPAMFRRAAEWSTKFYAGGSPATFRSSSLRSSSLSSTSQPRRQSASIFPSHLCCVQTR